MCFCEAMAGSGSEGGINLPADIRLAAALSDYAVKARYPSPVEPVTEEEYRQAVDLPKPPFAG